VSRVEIILLDRRNPYCAVGETFRYIITNMIGSLG
jgi:hypothetical protein